MSRTLQNPKSKTENNSRVRGPNLRVFVKRAEGVSYRKALELADQSNLVLASNKRMTKALVETDEWKSIREAFACWSGTTTGYKKPGKKLGKFVEYTDPGDGQKYVFPVPEQYRSEKNMILVVEHPNFSLVQDGKNLVVEASEVVGLTHFPKEDGWYLGDKEFDVPTGKGVSRSDEKARYLWRIDSRVGPVARADDYIYGGNRRGAYLGVGPSSSLGVVVESPEGGAPEKLEASSEQKVVLEIPENIPGNLRALVEKFSDETHLDRLRNVSKEEVLRVAIEFAQALGPRFK